MRLRPSLVLLIPVLFMSSLLAGCGEQAVDLSPPEGWAGTDTRWWRTDVDTTGLFRSLETLDDLGVEEEVIYGTNRVGQAGVAEAQIINAVKRSLIRMYRHRPEVVDSLFEALIVPEIQSTPVEGDLSDYVATFKEKGVEKLRRQFREPQVISQLGTDVPVHYPDSLRQANVSGNVGLQVYVNEAGEPVAIEVLESVHPVLDRSALRSVTQVEWLPAYVLKKRNWKELPAWERISVNFRLRN